MVGMAERLQSIEGQLNEIKAMLHQMQGASAGASGSASAPRPPRTKRPPPAGGEPK
jgi:hypothetical protein